MEKKKLFSIKTAGAKTLVELPAPVDQEALATYKAACKEADGVYDGASYTWEIPGYETANLVEKLKNAGFTMVKPARHAGNKTEGEAKKTLANLYLEEKFLDEDKEIGLSIGEKCWRDFKMTDRQWAAAVAIAKKYTFRGASHEESASDEPAPF
jgi:hypothetical protein